MHNEMNKSLKAHGFGCGFSLLVLAADLLAVPLGSSGTAGAPLLGEREQVTVAPKLLPSHIIKMMMMNAQYNRSSLFFNLLEA